MEEFASAAERSGTPSDEGGKLVLTEQVTSILTDAGLSHVVLFRCFGVQVSTDSIRDWTRASAAIPTDIIVYDLSTRTEVFRERVRIEGVYEHNRDPRVLERSKLALLRAKSKEWISAFVERELRNELRWR